MGRLGEETLKTLRHRVWLQLDLRETREHGPSIANWIIFGLIIVAVTLTVLETEETIAQPWRSHFHVADRILGLVFIIEYLLRVWCMAERTEFSGWRGRLHYMVQPAALIDLIALLPFIALFGGQDLFVLRIVRLARIAALGRLGEFSAAFLRVLQAVGGRLGELAIALVCAGFVMLVAATALYLAERAAQPEAFGSIPRALWWAVATITTVGYGDVYPITALGRVLAAIAAVTGIIVLAMPAGIMAAAFSEALQEHRAERHARRMGLRGPPHEHRDPRDGD
jgi:voltage-gated potassium channel